VPTAIDNLSKDSPYADIMAAISQCIQQEIDNGRSQEQATAICYSMAEKIVGPISRGSKGVRLTSSGMEEI